MKTQTYIVAGLIFALVLYITTTRRECIDNPPAGGSSSDSSSSYMGSYLSSLAETAGAAAGAAATITPRPPTGSIGDGLSEDRLNKEIADLVRQGIPESSNNQAMKQLQAWRTYWSSSTGKAELANKYASGVAQSGWESVFGAFAGAGSIAMIAFLTIVGIIIVAVILRYVWPLVSPILGMGPETAPAAPSGKLF